MPRRYYLLLILITLVAALLRLWQLAAVPPGLHYDLAATALLGNEVAFHSYRPIFISAYTGHEALFYYWLALWFRLIGSSVFALRLAVDFDLFLRSPHQPTFVHAGTGVGAEFGAVVIVAAHASWGSHFLANLKTQ